jgi:hypothetical protein
MFARLDTQARVAKSTVANTGGVGPLSADYSA